MKRRDFLKFVGLTAPVVGMFHAKKAEAFPNQPTTHHPENPYAPQRLSPERSKRVLVIGGGLAGLSAALELAGRGYAVVVREASDVLGGRLSTRRMHTPAGDFSVEHGIHMWFNNYHNFKDIRSRLGIDHLFRPYKKVHFVYRTYKPEVLESSPPIYPLNLINLLSRSPNLNPLDALRQLRGMIDVMYYNHKDVYRRFDGETFAAWAKRTGISQKFYEVLLEPAASVTLNDPKLISAAEMILYMHYFFVGQPRAMDREITTVDHGTAVIGPWTRRLESLGVTIETGRPVSGLTVKSGRVVGTLGHQDRFDWVVLATDVPGVRKIIAKSLALDAESTAAFSAVATNLSQLRVAPPYKILRVWFDRPTDASHPDVIETPQHQPINLVAQFHLLEDESRAWAQKNGGSILEFHLYANPIWSSVAENAVWPTIRPVVLELFPELARARVIAQTVGSYENFTSFEGGQGGLRPTATRAVQSGLSNLLFAGDWVHTDYPSALMERAVSTGREAANHILLFDGVRQAKLVATSGHGPGVL